MNKGFHARKDAADKLALLAYLQHMVDTARGEAARQLFQLYLEMERRRLVGAGLLPAGEIGLSVGNQAGFFRRMRASYRHPVLEREISIGPAGMGIPVG